MKNTSRKIIKVTQVLITTREAFIECPNEMTEIQLFDLIDLGDTFVTENTNDSILTATFKNCDDAAKKLGCSLGEDEIFQIEDIALTEDEE